MRYFVVLIGPEVFRMQKKSFCVTYLKLLQELSEEIEDYTQRFNTEDQLEWNLVLQEVATFIKVISPRL